MTGREGNDLLHHHLLHLAAMTAGDLRPLLEGARRVLVGEAPGAVLSGVTVGTLFAEPSTRTRLSLTLAGERLGARVLDFSGASTSAAKGESLADTARTAEAMGASVLAVRTGQCGGAALVAGVVRRAAVLNAGDGRHAHPTQGLIDALVFAEAHGRVPSFDLSGLTYAIVGDVVSSRVARSDAHAMAALGAQVLLCGPASMAPRSLASLAPGAAVVRDLAEVLERADGVQVLRVQLERHGGALLGDRAAYRERYGLTAARLAAMKPGAVVMHPGPMNRGLEIDGEAADSPRCRVLRQVEAGVAVRMAVLARAAGRALFAERAAEPAGVRA